MSRILNDDDDDIIEINKPISKDLKKKRKIILLDAEETGKKMKKNKDESEKLKKQKKEQEREEEQRKFHEYYDFGEMKNYPMYAFTIRGSMLKKVLDILNLLTTEAILQFTPTELRIVGVEESMVAMVLANFPANNLFFSYQCKKKFEFGIETKTFSKIIQKVSS